MKDEHPHPNKLTEAEQKLIERLRERPELMERFAAIVELSANTETIKQADEVEALLIEEIRRLGNVTMEGWASGVEKVLGQQLKQKDPSAVVRKKNVKLVVRLWCGEGKGEGLACQPSQLCPLIATGHWRDRPWSLKAVGPRVN
jgi:hypothetical protein